MAVLARKLGFFEAVGLSISMIAPTVAMAFNVSLTAKAAGPAAPLTFAIGTIVLLLVGASYIAFGRRVAHAGSAYAYVSHTFGRRWGFIAGWTLFLSYLTFTAAMSTLVGNFLHAVVRNYGLDFSPLWVVFCVAAILVATYCAYRDMRVAARLMLVLEGLSVLAIMVLCVVILVHATRTGGLTAEPFVPSPQFGGWAGIGYGLVFAILSFAGFEGASTLGEEVTNPRRTIPIALAGTVIVAGAFFTFASYAQVIGYGPSQIAALGNADAPLNELAIRYISRDFATAIDLAAAFSAFAGILGALSAAARLLFALGRAGLAPRLGEVTPKHGTPGPAVLFCGAACLVGVLVWAPRVGPANYYDYLGTIGTLGLILVYMGVTGADMVEAGRGRSVLRAVLAALTTVMLVWPLYNSLWPVPGFPDYLWPYVVVAWILLGGLMLVTRPVVAEVAAEVAD